MVIPVFAAFERVPDSLIDASSDLGASDCSTLRMVVAPLVFPGIAAGSIFTFSLSLGDYIAVTIVGGKTQLLGNIIYGQLVTANNQPLAAALSIIPLAAIVAVPAGDAPHRRAGERLMLSTGARRAVRAWTVLVLVFLYVPLLLVVLNAFNTSRTFAFPPTGFTLQWWVAAWHSEGMWKSLANSVVVGLGATAIALVLGTMAAFAVQRYEFFGRERRQFPCGAADHAAGHRHRHRAQRDVHLGAGRHARAWRR